MLSDRRTAEPAAADDAFQFLMELGFLESDQREPAAQCIVAKLVPNV